MTMLDDIGMDTDGPGEARRPSIGILKVWHLRGLLALGILLMTAACTHTGTRNDPRSAANHHQPPSSPSEYLPTDSVAPQTPPPPAITPPAPLSMRATLSHQQYSASPSERRYLRVDLSTVSEAVPARRPLNLGLLIDMSGSMAEDEKFKHAIQATGLVVENLSDKDVISVVAFNAAPLVLSPAGFAVNKEFLRHRMGDIVPKGWTNLSAGLLEAFNQLESFAGEDRAHHVIVLTDGNANRGVTSSEELRKLVGAARSRGTSLSTIGCGVDFDENVLSTLAEAGGGRYTYIHSGEQIPLALAAELGGLLDVVAQNVRMEIQAAENTRITRVYGHLIGQPVEKYTFALGDIRARDQSFFLVELAPLEFTVGASMGADVELVWDDPNTGSRERAKIRPRAAFSADELSIRQSEDIGVTLFARVLDSLELTEEAILGLDTERFDQVSESFEDLVRQARGHAIETRDQQLLNQLYFLGHLKDELVAVYELGLTHGHEDAKRRLEKEVDYRRYLMEHHRP